MVRLYTFQEIRPFTRGCIQRGNVYLEMSNVTVVWEVGLSERTEDRAFLCVGVVCQTLEALDVNLEPLTAPLSPPSVGSWTQPWSIVWRRWRGG